jgi:hypothetical protein
MLKYIKRFGNIKTRPIFATVLIQQRYTSELYHIQKQVSYIYMLIVTL